MPGRPAVFLDRGGCLTEEMDYINHPSRIRLLPRAGEAARGLDQAGVPPVVARGMA
jgi:D-glycero-D-manno-heptose 1,7-bisphosphate phosphatase